MNAPKNDGGPAFPSESSCASWQCRKPSSGMSLRQWYTGQALCGTIASYAGMSAADQEALVINAGGPEAFAAIVGRAAVMYADAALGALESNL